MAARNPGVHPDSPHVVPVPTDLAKVIELPLSEKTGLFGSIKLNSVPFEIVLNSKVLTPRKQVSLVHEMLHAFMELHKMHQFPHDKLHDLAVFIHGEVLPVLVAHSEDIVSRGATPESVITHKRVPNNVTVQQDQRHGKEGRGAEPCPRHPEGRCDCTFQGRVPDQGNVRRTHRPRVRFRPDSVR